MRDEGLFPGMATYDWPSTATCGDCHGAGSITIAPPDQSTPCLTCDGTGRVAVVDDRSTQGAVA